MLGSLRCVFESTVGIKNTKVFVLVTLIFMAALAALWWNWEPLAIQYHRTYMNSSLTHAIEVGPRANNQSDYLERYDYHLAALVSHGYFERREFVLSHISVPTIESRRLWQELQERFPDHPHVTMSGYEPTTTDMIVVWDRPDRMKQWEDIILAHDKPNEPSLVPTPTIQRDDLVGFVGSWINEEGGVTYEILFDDSGALRIKPSTSEVWTTAIKNVRIESQSLLFDQYNYIPAMDGLKTIMNRTGDHPFSGVRCSVELSLAGSKLNQLTSTISTIHLKKPITSILKRQVLIPDAP